MNNKISNLLLKSTYQIIQQRIVELQERLTKQIPKEIQESYRTGGGWHDNALWEASLGTQNMLDQEFSSLVMAVRNPVFIEDLWVLYDEEEVSPGKTVRVKNADTGEFNEYSIVGPTDVIYNPVAGERNFVSHKAPFIQSLIGKSAKDKITLEFSGEKKTLLITEVKPLSVWEQAEKER